jgi:hypothetical protein
VSPKYLLIYLKLQPRQENYSLAWSLKNIMEYLGISKTKS